MAGHAWADYVAKYAEAYGPTVGYLYALGHLGWIYARRLRARKAKRVELDAATHEALRVLLDIKREELQPQTADEDELDIGAHRAVRRVQVDEVRDRYWLALGRKRSAPSRAPADTSPEDP